MHSILTELKPFAAHSCCKPFSSLNFNISNNFSRKNYLFSFFFSYFFSLSLDLTGSRAPFLYYLPLSLIPRNRFADTPRILNAQPVRVNIRPDIRQLQPTCLLYAGVYSEIRWGGDNTKRQVYRHPRILNTQPVRVNIGPDIRSLYGDAYL